MAAAHPITRVAALSSLACDLCKKRKSACDRQIPSCSFCRRSANCCTYPTVRLKPGPKLGSHHHHRRLRSIQSRTQDVNDSASNAYYAGTHQESSHIGPSSVEGGGDSTQSSPETSVSIASSSSPKLNTSNMAAVNLAKAISLSSFLYPSHEASDGSPPARKERSQPGFLLVLAEAQENLTKACKVLRTSIPQAQSLIDLFFEMVAGIKSLSIFHQPSFPDKIRGIQDPNHIISLFAAMFSLSSRLSAAETGTGSSNRSSRMSHQEYHSLSLKYIHMATEACTNNAPPLCLLQAITLAGYYKLVNGVYGPAWRLVGTGVRIAYELRLHLIDYKGSEKPPSSDSELMAWSLDEERRRCWWALWEMDIFASTIQRAPPAIDWSANETYLPIADENWFSNKYQASCLLHETAEERWKRLKNSGNENSVAWINIFTSLMHDGRLLSEQSIKGIISGTDSQRAASELTQSYRQDCWQRSQEFPEKLSRLVRAYQETTENLPAALSYNGERLSFGIVEGDDPFSMRRASAGKYSMIMMSASARFMIYQNYVFADIIKGLIPLSFSKADDESSVKAATSNKSDTARQGLRKYLEAGDMVLQVLPNCPEDHVRYVNPYYASTVWIAAALQVFKRISLRDNDSDRSQRQYALLRRTYLRFREVWDTPSALLQNLDSLQARLETRQRELEVVQGQAKNVQGGDKRAYSVTGHLQNTDAVMPSGDHDYLFNDWPTRRSDQCDASQPFLCGPNASYPDMLAQDANWQALMDSEFDLSVDEAALSEQYLGPWPSEMFMGNLSRYSSDVMAGLSHGYTA